MSPAFGDSDWIPTEYSADGSEPIVPLEFAGVPPEAVSLALAVHDSDVPVEHRPDGFDHWPGPPGGRSSKPRSRGTCSTRRS